MSDPSGRLRLRERAVTVALAVRRAVNGARRAVRTVVLYRDPEIAEWTRLAYRDMVEWFGEPIDADWAIVAHYGPTTGTKKIMPHHLYLLAVSADHAGTDWGYAILAELVCRRVLVGRRGIIEDPWVRQMVETSARWHSAELRGRRDPSLGWIRGEHHDRTALVSVSMMKEWTGLVPGRTRGFDPPGSDALVQS